MRDPGSSRRAVGLFLVLLLVLPLAWTACSPGENSVLNPGTNRTGLTAPPETLRVPAVADRNHRARISTGVSQVLQVAHADSVEAIAFLRFTDIPADTASLSGARLGILLSGGSGSSLRLAGYAITPSTTWAWGEAADSANQVYLLTPSDTSRLAPTPFDVSLETINPPASDTVFTRGVIRIDGATLRRWVRLPAENEGIALRISANSPPGEIRFLSRQGVPDSSRSANPALEFMQGDSVVAVRSPSADAFLYLDRRPREAGDLATLTIADWLPQQAILRFPVLDSLKARYGARYSRVSIERGMLHLRAVAKPDSLLRLAVHGIRTDAGWDEATDPETFTLVGTTDIDYVTDRLTLPGLGLRLECGTGVRDWVRGGREDGVVVRSTGELASRNRMSFYSREAADSLRPWLEVVYTRPPDPRWGQGGGK